MDRPKKDIEKHIPNERGMTVKELGRLRGLIPATFTPLDQDGELNLKIIPDYVEHLAANGIEYIFVNGTTGEGPSLTVEERKTLVEVWVQASKGALKGVMVHVGGGNAKESCDLAKHAQACGAVGTSAASSTYFKPTSVKSLVEYCKMIADGAPSLPFYYYHIPGITGVDLPLDDFYSLAINEIPNFRGIKFSSTDLIVLGSCLKIRNQHPHHELFWGVDEANSVALDHGLEACIGSTYNMLAPVNHLMMSLQRRGEREAMFDWLFFVQDLIKAYKKLARDSSFLGVMKATTSLVTGIELGPVRLPLTSVDDRGNLVKTIEALGVVKKIQLAKKKLAEQD